MRILLRSFFFFFNDTATTEIYTLSLHDALPILKLLGGGIRMIFSPTKFLTQRSSVENHRSEEHTSELQSLTNLVCRLLLEKKKYTTLPHPIRNTTRHQNALPTPPCVTSCLMTAP